MAQIRETRYICDSCGKQVEKRRDLRKFDLIQHDAAGRWDTSTHTDLCEACESEFLEVAARYFPDNAEEDFAAMHREPATKTPGQP